MTDDFDTMLADFRQRRQATHDAAEVELSRVKAALADHADAIRADWATETERINALISRVSTQTNQATDAAIRLQQDNEGMRQALNANRAVLRRQARWAWTAVGGACLAAVAIILLAGWAAGGLIDSARTEADALRAANVDELAMAREDGQRAIAELHEQLAAQRAEIERRVDDVGAEFAALTAERDDIRAELDRFIELRNRLGITLVEGQRRPLIIVPEGQEIRAWGAPGLSNLARYNGRMYRVMAQR